jgi:hypothetical protein
MKMGMFIVIVPYVGGAAGGRYLFDANDIKAMVHQPEMSIAGVVNGR